MKNHSILLGTLTVTAILMAVILLATPSRETQGSMLANNSDFTMVTAGTAGGDEALTIIDNRNERALVYRLSNNNVELIGTMTSAQFTRYFARNAPR